MTILDQIVETKRAELVEAMRVCPQEEMIEHARYGPAVRGFRRALQQETVAVIAEVKKASPSKGIFRDDFNPVEIARGYEAGGAAALSVLTDETYFQGCLEDLGAVRSAVALPVLRKDFTIHPYQVYQGRAVGADAILLIVAILEEEPLRELYCLAGDLGMDALVEVHTPREMQVAARLGADLIGINNRNLKTFETTLEVTAALAAMAPPGAVLAALSGITTREDVVTMAGVGVRAVLVGEALMRSPDIEQSTRRLAQVPLARPPDRQHSEF